ncbi:hypothetical protein KOXY103107_02265 [Komagataeibacter xylinus]
MSLRNIVNRYDPGGMQAHLPPKSILKKLLMMSVSFGGSMLPCPFGRAGKVWEIYRKTKEIRIVA